MPQLRTKPAWFFIALALWALWSLLVIAILVPVLERHFHLHRALAAWFLCVLPAIGALIAWALRVQKV